MSHVEDGSGAVVSNEVLDDRYRRARAKLESSRKIEAGQGGAVVFAALAYGETLDESSLFKTVSHLAKLFCIAALFLIPNLLVVHVLL